MTHHSPPSACRRGFLDGPCPACKQALDDADRRLVNEAILALAEASDEHLREAIHWLADEEPTTVIRMLDATRSAIAS